MTGADRAALRQKSGDAKSGGEDRGRDQMQRDRSVGGGRSDARQRAAGQHQHVRIGADRPFGEHDEDQARPQRRPRRRRHRCARRRAGCRPPAGRTRSSRRRHENCSARSGSRRADRPRASRTRSARSAPSSAGGPNMKPHTTSNAARMKPGDHMERMRRRPSTDRIAGRGRSTDSANAIVVTASQRHSRMRARPKAAAVTMAR